MIADQGLVEQPDSSDKNSPAEVLLRVEGTVQGVGYRPFVYRVACDLGVRGWVLNDVRGVLIRAHARPDALARFEAALRQEAPPAARVDRVYAVNPDPATPPLPAGDAFVILDSRSDADIDAQMPPDLAVCADCLREMRDPKDRRYLYPFINCTNCGPRFSIIEKIPYDRPNTTMKGFPLCLDCQAEYDNPTDRRFHAQPVACPVCGPRIEFWNATGKFEVRGDAAIDMTVKALAAGKIVAVKGIGGFHLLCDAADRRAVETLRERKRREEKPFALMLPNLDAARRLCRLTNAEEAMLSSPQAPIVLLPKEDGACREISDGVAPGNPLLGVMLPYSPLHHLLIDRWKLPLVATSGNVSDEPIRTDESDAVERLDGIADAFLVHNRPIARPVDDSIARFMLGEPLVLRRARGYAPTPIPQRENLPPLLAVGAHLKNTIAVAAGRSIFPSQHIGDLSTAAACDAFAESVITLSRLYRAKPLATVCDLHPDYHSSLWAARRNSRLIRVQHHHAHVLSCIAEHHITDTVLGVAWDGTGYGSDGTIWGGEWLVARADSPRFRRAAHLRTFHLPGGEAAIHRPALTALGMLWEALGEEALDDDEVMTALNFSSREVALFESMLRKKINSPLTSSAGRLFDGMAALLGLGVRSAFEGQPAMKLEWCAAGSNDSTCYDFRLREADESSQAQGAPPPIVVDWTSLLLQVLDDIRCGAARSDIAKRFHNTLAEMIAAVAREMPHLPVALTGGCFQNKLLTESAVRLLQKDGLDVFRHGAIPPNDGGIAIGQILAGAATIAEGVENPST